MSSARLVSILMLLMTLSAGASIWLAWLPPSSTSAAIVAESTRKSDSSDTPPVSSLWERVGSQTNSVLLTAYVLNLALALTVFVLLRRHGRYRHTLFAKAFRSSPLSISISTLAEGRYLDVNHAFLQMLGYERQDVIGQAVKDLWDLGRPRRSGTDAGSSRRFQCEQGAACADENPNGRNPRDEHLG